MSDFYTVERADNSESALDPKEIVGVLRRQLRLILLTMLIAMGLALAFLVAATPKFTAQTLVLYDPAPKNLLDTEQVALSAQLADARIESEVEILRSMATSLAVIERANLLLEREFTSITSPWQRVLQAIGLWGGEDLSREEVLTEVIENLQDATTIRRRGLTYIIAIEVTSETPELAASLASTTAEVYIEAQVGAKVASSLSARDALQAQVDAARGAIEAWDNALDEFVDLRLAELEAEGGNRDLIELREELDALTASVGEVEQTADALATALAGRTTDIVTVLSGNAALSDLVVEREQLAARLLTDQLSEQDQFDLRAALESLERDLQQRAEEALRSSREQVVALSEQADRVRADIRDELLSSDIGSASLAQIFELQQEAAIARTQYQTILSRVRDTEAQARLQVADSRIVSLARAPNEPSSPHTQLVLLSALLAGAGLGVGLAFLNEYFVGGITSADQLRDVAKAPVAATIPFMPVNPDGNGTMADGVIDAPLSIYSEAIRKLRASLDQAWREQSSSIGSTSGQKGGDGRVILITSTLPAEGKTTLALALARVYAISGRETLLIDADLRKPGLYRQLAFQPEVGLLDHLRAPLEHPFDGSFLREDQVENLTLALGVGRPTLPTDQLISSAQFDELLATARRNFEIVIIDSSPLLPVVDARYIAHHADAVVMPVRYATTSQSDLRNVLSPLRQAMKSEAPLFTVLSHRQHQSARHRYSEYYMGYGNVGE